jgi:prefoldin subunit 5
MSMQSSMKSIEAQLDRIERQLESAQRSFSELEAMLFEAKIRSMKNEKTSD